MSYEVLARKLRPGVFSALVGQDHVVRALSHALDHDRLHHAYLFTGTRGVGKTTIARILAKCLNCETNGVSAEPCGSCTSCEEIASNRFVDLIEVDAASRTGVADTRELLENAQYLPTRGRYKVYLIDEVHMLSNAAFNALLKTLEEPPPHVLFLLATTEAKKVPITVLSRCLQFQLKNMTEASISSYLGEVLAEEGIEFDTAALDIIAKSARGSMRDALSLTDQAVAFGQGRLHGADVSQMLGVVGRDEVGALLAALADGDAGGLLKITEEFADRAVDFSSVLSELLAAFHERSVAYALDSADIDRRFTPEALQLFYQIALMGLKDLNLTPDARIGFEMTLLRMLSFAPTAQSQVPPVASPTGGGAENVQSPTGDPSATSARDRALAEPMAAPVEAAKQPLPAALQHWYQWVHECGAQGVAKMLLDYSVLESDQEDRLGLLLDDRHDTLLNDAQLQSMERCLSAYLQRSVTIEIRIGTSAFETPAQRQERLRQERQQAAERAVEEDAVVQNLLEAFGGRVQQVIPIEPQ